MKTACFIFTFICILTSTLIAGPEEDVSKSAQSFYSAYLKVLVGSQDTKSWILKSDKVTSSFKKAYATYMKDPGSDPIICAQDYPDAGFKVSAAKINGNNATVTLMSKDPAFAHTFRAAFIQKEAKWLLTGTDEIKAK